MKTVSGNAVNIGMTVVDETGTQITLLDAAAIDEMGYEMEGEVTMEEGREETTSSSAVASAQNIQNGLPAQPSSETPPIVTPPVSNAKTESGVSQASPRATTIASAKDPVPTGGGEGTAGQPSKKSKAQRDAEIAVATLQVWPPTFFFGLIFVKLRTERKWNMATNRRKSQDTFDNNGRKSRLSVFRKCTFYSHT